MAGVARAYLLAAIVALSLMQPPAVSVASAEHARMYWARYSVYAEVWAAGRTIVVTGMLSTNITFNGSAIEITRCLEEIAIDGHGMRLNACSTYSYSAERPGDAAGWFIEGLVGNINKFAVNSSMPVKVEMGYGFQGSDSYKGYPVLKYSFTMKVETSLGLGLNASITRNASITMRGVVFIHSGVPAPIYVAVNTTVSAWGFATKYSYTADIESSNLPATAPTGIIELPHTTIIVGGEPDASIRVTGSKGDTRISINNTGTGYGYVTVIGKAARLEAGEEEAKKDYVVPPKTGIIIDLGEPLDRNIDESVEAAVLPSYVYYIAVLAAAVLVLLLALLALLRKKP